MLSRIFKLRLALAAVLAVVTAAAIWGGAFVVKAGLYRPLTPVRPGACEAVRGFTGPEDIAIDRERGLAYITSADRFGVFNRGAAPGGTIMLLRLDRLEQGPTPLMPLDPDSFFPHGLDLWIGPDGERRLFAVNHGADGQTHSVEIFEVTSLGRLVHTETVRSPAFTDPNDIVAMGPDRFYVTNLYGSQSSFGRGLERYLFRPRADIVYFDGDKARPVQSGLRMANGIVAGPQGERIFAAEVMGRKVRAYARLADTGALEPLWQLRLPMGVDNLTLGPEGALWAAGHPRLLEMSARMRRADVASPSEVIRIDWQDRETPRWRTVFLDETGERFSAASVAAVHDGRLLLGAVFGGRMLTCATGEKHVSAKAG